MLFRNTLLIVKSKIRIISVSTLLVLLFLYLIGYLLKPNIIVFLAYDKNKNYDFYKYINNTFGAPTYLYGPVCRAYEEFKSAAYLDSDVLIFHKPISASEASQILTYISKGGHIVFIASEELVASDGFKSLFKVSKIIEDLKLPPQGGHFMIRNIDWRYAKREVPWEKDFKVVQYALNQQSTLLKEAQLNGNPLVITSDYNKGKFSIITFDLGKVEKWRYSGGFLAKVIYLTMGTPFLYYIHPLYNVSLYLTIAVVISFLLLIESFYRKDLLRNINLSLFLRQNRKELVVFGLIILLATVVRLWDITSLLPLPASDELWCIYNTKIMFEGKGFVFGAQSSEYELARQLLVSTPFFGITLIPIKLGEIISGDYYLGLRLSKAILSIISIIFIYFFTRCLFNKRTAVISILIMAFSQWHYVTSGIKNVTGAGYIIMFLITCLWLFWWGVKKDSKYFIPFGVILGIIPEINITYTLPLILIFFVATDRDARVAILKPNFWIGILIITIFIFPSSLVKREGGFHTYKYFYSKINTSSSEYIGVKNLNGSLLETIHYNIWRISTIFLQGIKTIFKKFFIGAEIFADTLVIGNTPVFELIEYIFALPALIFIFLKSFKKNSLERFFSIWFIAGFLPVAFVMPIYMATHLFLIPLSALTIIIAFFINSIYERLKIWNAKYVKVFTLFLVLIFIVSGYQLFINYVILHSTYNDYKERHRDIKGVTYDENQKEVFIQARKMGKFLEEFQKNEPEVHIVVENWDVEKLVLLGTSHAYLPNLWIGNLRFVCSASLTVPGFASYPFFDKTKVYGWEKGKNMVLYVHTTDLGAKILYASLYAGGLRSNIYEKISIMHPNLKPLKVFRYLNGKPIFEIYKVVPSSSSETI